MRYKKRFTAVLAGALCLLAGCGAQPEPKEFEQTMLYFDTVITISFYAGENGEELMQHCMDM